MIVHRNIWNIAKVYYKKSFSIKSFFFCQIIVIVGFYYYSNNKIKWKYVRKYQMQQGEYDKNKKYLAQIYIIWHRKKQKHLYLERQIWHIYMVQYLSRYNKTLNIFQYTVTFISITVFYNQLRY